MSQSINGLSAPLHQILGASAAMVREVGAGRSLTDALTDLPVELRPATQAIGFYTMRHFALGKALTHELLKKAPNNWVSSLLTVALCLLNEPEDIKELEQAPQYDEFTVVNEAVKAAGKHKKMVAYKALINACLRRFLREKDDLLAKVRKQEEVIYGYPYWWIKLVRQSYPEQWQSILAASQIAGPMTLRINQRATTLEQYQQLLLDEGFASQIIGKQAIVLDKAVNVARLPYFDEGYCSVQDAGAQLAAELIDFKADMRVLDACAAPGGKTAHILEIADVDMTVLDIDDDRLDRVYDNLDRLQLMSEKVRLFAADASELTPWWDGEAFDVIMADVPCTASGIVRRHPDIKWLRREEDVAKTVALQRSIVQNLWQTLAPNGYFLYITCSVFPAEGEQQAQWIETFADAKRLDAPGQLLPLSNSLTGASHDGFFYALFQKVL